MNFVELLAIQQSSEVIMRPAESKQDSTEDIKGTNNDNNDNNTNDHVLVPSLYKSRIGEFV